MIFLAFKSRFVQQGIHQFYMSGIYLIRRVRDSAMVLGSLADVLPKRLPGELKRPECTLWRGGPIVWLWCAPAAPKDGIPELCIGDLGRTH